jgi:hypothetical protein
MSQRSVSERQLAYILEYGKEYNRAGATWYVLREKDVPPADRADEVVEKAIGAVVWVTEGQVVTVYKRERPSLYVRKKPKYGAHVDWDETLAEGDRHLLRGRQRRDYEREHMMRSLFAD